MSRVERWKKRVEHYTNEISKTKSRERLSVLHSHRGKYYYCLGNYPQAFSDANDSLKYDKKNSDAYALSGMVHYKSGNYNDSVKDLSKAIELYPFCAEYYTRRGLAYHERRDYDKAIQDFDRVILNKPLNSQAFSYRGLSYKKVGKYHEAIEDYNKAILINTKNRKAEKNLEELLEFIGKNLDLFMGMNRYISNIDDISRLESMKNFNEVQIKALQSQYEESFTNIDKRIRELKDREKRKKKLNPQTKVKLEKDEEEGEEEEEEEENNESKEDEEVDEEDMPLFERQLNNSPPPMMDISKAFPSQSKSGGSSITPRNILKRFTGKK